MRTRRPGAMGWSVIGLVVVAVIAFAAWRWAVAAGSAGTLDWIDARFSRERAIELAASGRYGEHPAQRAELWRPRGEGGEATGRPLVVFVHGGGWHSGAPEDYRFVARTFGDEGYATALIGYRLVPDGRYPAMLEDSAAALRWVRERSMQTGLASGELVLIGHSAGAYNVLMLGLDGRWLARAGVPADAVAGIVSLAGPADFFPFDKESSQNAFGHLADGRVSQPVVYATPATIAAAAPLLLMHGTADDVVRPYNSRNLAQAVERAGGAAQLIEYDGMSHAGLVMGLSRPFAQGGKVLDPLLAFIEGLSAPASRADASVPVQRDLR